MAARLGSRRPTRASSPCSATHRRGPRQRRIELDSVRRSLRTELLAPNPDPSACTASSTPRARLQGRSSAPSSTRAGGAPAPRRRGRAALPAVLSRLGPRDAGGPGPPPERRDRRSALAARPPVGPAAGGRVALVAQGRRAAPAARRRAAASSDPLPRRPRAESGGPARRRAAKKKPRLAAVGKGESRRCLVSHLLLRDLASLFAVASADAELHAELE